MFRELDDDVAAAKPGFFGRPAFDNAAQEQTLHFGGVVWNRSREGTHRVPAASFLLRPGDFDEHGALVEIGELLGENRGELRDPLQVFEIDELGAVRRPVILLVRAGKEVVARDLGLVEAHHVRG